MRIKNKNRIRVIGKLIRIYREEKRHNTQNEYTLLRFCDGICTINTLKRIESGECSRSDEVYDELLAKLKLRFDYFPEVDTAVEMMMEPLYEAIEYFDLEGIGRICDKILNLLERVRNYVYYSELYNIFKNLRQYYIDDLTISTGIALRYESLLGIMPPIYSIILKFLIMTRKSIDALDDPNIYNTAIKKLEMINEKCLFLQFFVLKYYITTNQYISLMQLLNKLEMIFLSKENYIRLIDLYNYYFMLYTVIEHGLRDEYIQKVDNIAKSEKIPNYKLSEIYSNIASNLIFEKNYKRALEFFEKMLRYKEVPHITEIIYMASCQSHLELPIDIPDLTPDLLAEYSIVLQYMYNYFKYYDVPVEILLLMLDQLYNAIEFYDIPSVKEYCQKALTLLERVRNYVVYSELYMLFKDVYDHFQYDIIISRDSMHHYLKLIEIMPDAYDDLIRLLILNRLPLDAIENGKEYNNHIKKLCLYNTKHLFMKLHLLHYYAYTEQFESFKLILDDLEKRYNSFKNYVRLLDVYNYAIILYSKIQLDMVFIYLKKVDYIIENFYVPNEKIGETYSNIANQFHIHCKYHDALMYFSKMIKYQNIYYITDLIYMANCQSVLNKEINIPILSKMEIEKYPQILRKMYNFYLNYGISSPKEKQDFILNEIAPINEDKDLSEVFKFELKKAIKKNSCYKSLYLYEEIINNKVN